VGDAEGVGRGTGDVQAAGVGRAVVGAAEGDEVGGVVGAGFGAGLDVVDVDVEGVAAAGDLAAMLVAFEDAAAYRGGNGGSRSWWLGPRTHVGVDVEGRVLSHLGIAMCSLQHGGVDRDQVSAGALVAVLAVLADSDVDLVFGAASTGILAHGIGRRVWYEAVGHGRAGLVLARGGAAQRAAGEEQQGGVVIESFAASLAHVAHGFAKCGDGFAADLEAEDVAGELGSGGVSGVVSAGAAGDEVFDLAHAAAGGGVDPGGLGVAGCDARELADGAGVEASFGERSGELGQAFEGFGGAEFVLGGACPWPRWRSAYSAKAP